VKFGDPERAERFARARRASARGCGPRSTRSWCRIRPAVRVERGARRPIPAVNGCFTARSLARMYAALAGGGVLDGERFLSVETLRRATEIQTTGSTSSSGSRCGGGSATTSPRRRAASSRTASATSASADPARGPIPTTISRSRSCATASREHRSATRACCSLAHQLVRRIADAPPCACARPAPRRWLVGADGPDRLDRIDRARRRGRPPARRLPLPGHEPRRRPPGRAAGLLRRRRRPHCLVAHRVLGLSARGSRLLARGSVSANRGTSERPAVVRSPDHSWRTPCRELRSPGF
jgi:hypothetical protein